VMDLFCAAGLFSKGFQMAGFQPIAGVDFDLTAIQVYQANFPGAQVHQQNLLEFQWEKLLEVPDVLIASPDCRGHSEARGGYEGAQSEASRSTPNAVADAVEILRPPFFVVENVLGIRRWKGYGAWKTQLRANGYALDEYVIDAADLGVPQTRKRIFIIGNRGRHPMGINIPKMERVGAHTIIDEHATGWSRWEDLVPKTVSRVRIAIKKYGEQCVVIQNGRSIGSSLDQPIGALTRIPTTNWVRGDLIRWINVNECRLAMGCPPEFRLPESKSMAKAFLGKGVCPPVAKHIAEEILRCA